MESFSKDTLFNDLPQIIKQKIINIRNLSIQHKSIPLSSSNTTDLSFFEHISVPSSKNLCDTFLRMANSISNLENFDASANLKREIAEFSEFVAFYRLETNNTDFIGELEKTIGMMEDKFIKLKTEDRF